MGSGEILNLDVTALSERLRAKKISSVEVTKAYLDRIHEVDTKLGSYLTVTADRALSAAIRADHEISSGNWRGPFHGVPIGLKDNIYTRGVLTTAGSKVLGDFEPDFDATAWARLSAAGAVLLGKLNLNEFAFGGLNKVCRNPYALDRLPGGSSAGAAVAIVGHTAAAALGSDTSGSIRIPSSMCGCVGLKPTWSRVSRHGLVPLAQTMDHVGSMTRSVRDAAQMLKIIAGHDPDDATSSRELFVIFERFDPGDGRIDQRTDFQTANRAIATCRVLRNPSMRPDSPLSRFRPASLWTGYHRQFKLSGDHSLKKWCCEWQPRTRRLEVLCRRRSSETSTRGISRCPARHRWPAISS